MHFRLSFVLLLTGMSLFQFCFMPAYAAETAPGLIARTGTISVLHVEIPSQSALQQLEDGGYDIDAVHETYAVVYATATEMNRLSLAGFSYSVIRQSSGKEVKAGSSSSSLGVYHSYAGFTAVLNQVVADHPAITQLHNIGESANGYTLWALEISDHPGTHRNKPEAKFIGAIHGDESLSGEMCLYLTRYLTDGYGGNDSVTSLINSLDVWIVPLINPDGLESDSRYNGDGYDLNRSFPMFPEDYSSNVFHDGDDLTKGRPSEVAAIINWSLAHHFTLSANFHTGSQVVNYPYDDNGVSGLSQYSPDDALFQSISTAYAEHNPLLYNSTEFPGGIVNGLTWYRVRGGMQDWNYRYLGCNEVTIEISENKKPDESRLAEFWGYNRDSMMAYLATANQGIHGVITDRTTGAPLWAEVFVEDNAQPVVTLASVGDFHRMLLPGTYSIKGRAHGYLYGTASDVTVTSASFPQQNLTLASCDLNKDGVINSADLQLLIQAAVGNLSPSDYGLNDSDLNSANIQIVINEILGLE